MLPECWLRFSLIQRWDPLDRKVLRSLVVCCLHNYAAFHLSLFCFTPAFAANDGECWIRVITSNSWVCGPLLICFQLEQHSRFLVLRDSVQLTSRSFKAP